MAKRKSSKTNRGGGRSNRYSEESMAPADDVRARRPEAAQQTVSQQLSAEASRPMTDERIGQFAEAVAQASIEYSKNPAAANDMMAVYSDALASISDEPTLSAILGRADSIASGTLAADQLPSAVFLEGGETEGPVAQTASDPVREMAAQMRDRAQAMLDESDRTTLLPVREGAAPPQGPIPTTQGLAYPVGEPFLDQARAEQRGLLEGLGRKAGALSQSDTPILFQKYIADQQDTAPVVDSPDRILGLSTAIAQGGIFPEMLPRELTAGLSEYPNSVGDARVFPDEKQKARLAQVLADAVREGRTTVDNVVEQTSNLLGETSLGTYDNPLAGLVTDAPLADRASGDASITGVDGQPPNPVSQFNPILAGLYADSLAMVKNDQSLSPTQKMAIARSNASRAFADQYGNDLATPLFSYNQYGIQAPSQAVRDVRERMSGKQRDYADAMAAFNNVIEAVNQSMASGDNPLGGLRFAASNTGAPLGYDANFSQRSALANELSSRLAQRLGNPSTNKMLANYDAADPQSQAAMAPMVRGLLAGLTSGMDASFIPNDRETFLPVRRPESLQVGGGVVGQSDFTNQVEGSGRSPFNDKAELFAFLSNLDPRTGAQVRRGASDSYMAESGKYIDPYRHFSFTSKPMGLFFDPYAMKFGGAYVEGGSPYLPQQLSAELAANAMRYEQGAVRDAFINSLLRGYQALGSPDDVALGRRVEYLDRNSRRFNSQGQPFDANATSTALTELPTMPRATLRDALRFVPAGNFDTSAREIVNRALDMEGTPVIRELPSVDSMDGVTPADDDFGAIPSLYGQQPMGNTLRMARPNRLGPIASLLVA